MLQDIIAVDPMKRGIAALLGTQKEGALEQAAKALRGCKSVRIITGFYIPKGEGGGAAETDGPPGAAILGATLRQAGHQVQFVTDRRCLKTLRSAIQVVGFKEIYAEAAERDTLPVCLEAWESDGVNAVIAIERPAPSFDGVMRNMSGEPITLYHTDFSPAFAPGMPWVTFGIGDGGNEIGMGNVPWPIIEKAVKNGDRIASSVKTDHLTIAGVSNWGAYSLAMETYRDVAQDILTPETELEIVRRIVTDAGAVDGTTLRRTFTVDGLPMDYHAGIIRQIKELAGAP